MYRRVFHLKADRRGSQLCVCAPRPATAVAMRWLQVPGTTVIDDGSKPFTVYVIFVCGDNGDRWVVERRYSQWLRFNEGARRCVACLGVMMVHPVRVFRTVREPPC